MAQRSVPDVGRTTLSRHEEDNMDFSRFDTAQLRYFYKLLLSRQDEVNHSISIQKARSHKPTDRLIDLEAEAIVIDSLRGLVLSEIG